MIIDSLSGADRAAFVRICDEGARGAGRALATFIGAPDAKVEQRSLVVADPDSLAERLTEKLGEGEGAVVAFGLSGEATGALLHLLSASVSRRVAGRLLGKPADSVDLEHPRVQGALAEVGNIVASAFLNAISLRVGAPCLPSVPELAMGPADVIARAALARVVGSGREHGAMIVEVAVDGEPPVVFSLAFMPTPESLEAMITKAAEAQPGA